MSGTNGKLNNAQRSALVKVLEKTYGRKIKKLRKTREYELERITREVKSQLGVDKIDREMEELKDRISHLERRKEELGFSRYNDSPVPGTEAHRMITQALSSHEENIDFLEDEKDKKTAGIWTETDLSRAKDLVDEILQE
ncbi:hypothetical protein GF312_21980 [Candidatus Poribacteria bacterium]|nr:hypothetical protein [Candidatus Poribacteria bacterium]